MVVEYSEIVINAACGTKGPRGFQGMPNGPQGSQGATGYQGPQGVTGAQGFQGFIGVTGPQGPQGVTGPLVQLDQLTNVNTDGSSGSFLQYNGSEWVSTDLCSALNDVSLDCLGDVSSSGTTGSILQYDAGTSTWVTNTLCNALGDVSVNCLGDVTTTQPATGSVLTWTGSEWVDSEVIFETIQIGGTGIAIPTSKLIGEMFFEGSAQNPAVAPKLIGDVDITLKSLTNLQAGFNVGFDFVPYLGATPTDALIDAQGITGGDKLVCLTDGGIYLVTYSITVEFGSAQDIIYLMFLNGEPFNKSSNRSNIPGNSQTLVSSSFFIGLNKDDFLDFRIRLQTAPAKSVNIYHTTITLSRISDQLYN